MSPLRIRLRNDTRYDHVRIDSLYSRYNLTDAHDLSTFLKAHAVALSWCRESMPAAMGHFSRLIEKLIAAIAADLDHLGAPAMTAWPGRPNMFRGDPLGMVYVIAGSRLGGRVLLRNIIAASDPLVASSTSYFSCKEGDALWQDMLGALQDWSGSRAQEDSLVEGARCAFQYFEDAHFAVQGLLTDDDYQYRVA